MAITVRSQSRSTIAAGVLAPVGFLGAYLAVGQAAGAFTDRPLPLPGSPASEVVAFYTANPTAVGITAGLQTFSVVCFAIFVASIAPALRAAGAAWLPRVGYLSVAAMVVSSALSVALSMVATSTGEATVEVLRQASFTAGGVVNVVTLGVFVVGSALVLSRDRLIGKPTRWFGLVSGGIAVLSVLSLAIYYASIALPVGRVTSMAWTIIAGVVVYRRLKAENR